MITALQVFDHVQKFHICGAGLGMRLNGFAALSAIDSKLAEAVADLTAPVETNVMHSLDGMFILPYLLPRMYIVLRTAGCIGLWSGACACY